MNGLVALGAGIAALTGIGGGIGSGGQHPVCGDDDSDAESDGRSAGRARGDDAGVVGAVARGVPGRQRDAYRRVGERYRCGDCSTRGASDKLSPVPHLVGAGDAFERGYGRGVSVSGIFYLRRTTGGELCGRTGGEPCGRTGGGQSGRQVVGRVSERGQTERTAGGSRQPGIAAVQKWTGERQNPVERQFKGLDNRLRANILPSGKYR